MLKFQNEVRNMVLDFLKREKLEDARDDNTLILYRVLRKVLTTDDFDESYLASHLRRKYSKEQLGDFFAKVVLREPGKAEPLYVDAHYARRILGKVGLNQPEKRVFYRGAVEDIFDSMIALCNGNPEEYKEVTEKYDKYVRNNHVPGMRSLSRFIPLGVLIMLLNNDNNYLDISYKVKGQTKCIPWQKAKYLIFDIKNELGYELGAKKRRKDTSELIDNVKLIVEETSEENETEEDEEKVETIESLRLERDQYRSSLKLIEKNMDDLLERIKEETENIANEQIRDFFVSLNSGKYGNFLDKMPLTEETLKDIRRNNLDRDLPQEVKRVLIFIKAVLKFINDQGITPIRPINEVFEGTAEDIAKMDYSGSPFIGNEKKELKIVASGYKYKDMVISIPKVEEVE